MSKVFGWSLVILGITIIVGANSHLRKDNQIRMALLTGAGLFLFLVGINVLLL